MEKLWLIFLLPVMFGCEQNYRYPCQDPKNWASERCQKPICDVNRECPEHIFKGQNSPLIGPPKDAPAPSPVPAPTTSKGVNCK
jgi:hypothetical protein